MLQWKTTELFWTINRQENWEFEQRVFPFRFVSRNHIYIVRYLSSIRDG